MMPLGSCGCCLEGERERGVERWRERGERGKGRGKKGEREVLEGRD